MTFSVRLKDSEKKLGVLAAAYGVGALLAPISATKFASIKHWSFHYFVSLSFAVANVILLSASLRFRHMDGRPPFRAELPFPSLNLSCPI